MDDRKTELNAYELEQVIGGWNPLEWICSKAVGEYRKLINQVNKVSPTAEDE